MAWSIVGPWMEARVKDRLDPLTFDLICLLVWTRFYATGTYRNIEPPAREAISQLPDVGRIALRCSSAVANDVSEG